MKEVLSVNSDVAVFAGFLLVLLDDSILDLLHETLISLSAANYHVLLDELQESLEKEFLNERPVLIGLLSNGSELLAGLVKDALDVGLLTLENLETSRVQHLRALNLSLQFDVLLPLLEFVVDLLSGLEDELALLKIELFLRLRVNFVRLLVGLLLDEGHHVLDLLLHVGIGLRHGEAGGVDLRSR